MPLQNRLHAIDLFSGVGGLTLALRSVFETSLYVEVNTYCRNVLEARIIQNDLDAAPIHDDIRSLRLSSTCGARAIVAGFPCQDVSVMGQQAGIHGGRSSLFFEICRVLDDVQSIDVVFFENVDAIVRNGLREVLLELNKRGFTCAWTIVSAADCGSPQIRKRFFLLGVRNGFDVSVWKDVQVNHEITNAWASSTQPRRVSVRPSFAKDPTFDEEHRTKRYEALCNVVVPQSAAFAFAVLVRNHLKMRTTETSRKTTKVTTVSVPLSIHGFLLKGCVFSTDAPELPAPADHCFENTVVRNGEKKRMRTLPTPVSCGRHARSDSNLVNYELANVSSHVVHSNETAAWVKANLGRGVVPHDAVVLNVEFCEWLMGLPGGWTRPSKRASFQ